MIDFNIISHISLFLSSRHIYSITKSEVSILRIPIIRGSLSAKPMRLRQGRFYAW